MTEPMVLTEAEALEVLAYLVAAARTQVDEAAEYGPLRLITAAGRLAELAAPRASPSTRALLEGPLRQMPGTATKSNDHGLPRPPGRRTAGADGRTTRALVARPHPLGPVPAVSLEPA